MGRPATGCSTFGVSDFILVPLPAARIRTCGGVGVVIIGWRLGSRGRRGSTARGQPGRSTDGAVLRRTQPPQPSYRVERARGAGRRRGGGGESRRATKSACP